MSASDLYMRGRGMLLGLAIGDAVGTTVEFKSRGSFEPVTGMRGGGPFHLRPGQWTDDTSMALCLAESLLTCSGFDAVDQMQRYVRWWRTGYLSSTGVCFDIGSTVRASLARFERTGEPFSGSTDPYSAGNGCLMRLAGVPLFYHTQPAAAVRFCAESSRTTHGALECIDSSRLFGLLLLRALRGTTKEELLDDHHLQLAPRVAEIATGDFQNKNEAQIRGSGYVIDSLEASLWCFYNTDNFADSILAAANLGDDADTTAAITGQLAGAFYGGTGIPQDWTDTLLWSDRIGNLAEQLLDSTPA